MTLRRIFAVAAMMLVFGSAVSAAADWAEVDDTLARLGQVIGTYPPAVKTDAERAEAAAHYERTKATLDAALASQPNDMEARIRRAKLHAMGHNLDLPGAFNGAERDYVAVLAEHPTHQRAILDLAHLWVNTAPEYAPRAEGLFRAAQCLNKQQPLEEAQRGLFFAFYYQGRLEDAKRQADFLAAQWPQHTLYEKYREIAGSALERAGKRQHTQSKPPAMTGCG